jgi:hypothetical protein
LREPAEEEQKKRWFQNHTPNFFNIRVWKIETISFHNSNIHSSHFIHIISMRPWNDAKIHAE